MNLHKIIIINLIIIALSACETLPKRDPVFTPVQPVDLHPPRQTNGSIYQAGYDVRLFEDHTAKRIGDILTVKLDENTQAKKKADLDVVKENSVSATAPVLMGIDPSIIFGKDLSATLASKYDFECE
jgi:flagellar L-ring protein precursor FlgH